MKKIISFIVAIILAAGLFTGCGLGMTDEEKAEKQKQEMIQSMEEEENTTKMKRLTSVNLEESEIVLRNFVEGLQKNDTTMVSNAIGSPDVFDEKLLYGWMLENNYEILKNTPLQDIRIKTEKNGPQVTLSVFINTDKEEDAVKYGVVYSDNAWVLIPPSGVTTNFTFTAPTKRVNLKGVSLEKYVKSVDDNSYSWTFVIPFMAKLSDSTVYEVTSNLGTFEAKMYSTRNENLLLVNMTDEQKAEFEKHAMAAFNNVFTMLKADANITEVSGTLLSENLLMDCFPSGEDKVTAYKEKLATVGSVSMFEDDVQNGFPEAYTYRLSGEDAVTMNVKLKISTSSGDSRKKATIIMQNFDGIWKIVNVITKSNDNPFVSFEAFNPAW